MKKIVIGILIMMLGVFLLFNNMGFFNREVYSIVISWPMLVVAIGTVLLFDRPSDHKSAGTALIIIGALFLMPKIFDVNTGGLIVPLLIIAAGLFFVIKSVRRRNNVDFFLSHRSKRHYNRQSFFDETVSDEEGYIRREYVFAGSKEKWGNSKVNGKIKSVEIDAIFSGVEIDLTQTELSDEVENVSIKVSSVFSGVTLYVPEEWKIIVQKNGVFGGFNDNRPRNIMQSASSKIVILEIDAIFGGGEIKCYE
ncbi:MAG: cell wall-active antibiotics response protein [Candidatus Azobacteroides sp.]|nr:cell wall-active antibiotics response protein [Candidatus Azobacteroides sp.]